MDNMTAAWRRGSEAGWAATTGSRTQVTTAGSGGRLLEQFALACRVATPSGWKTLAELTVGDYVYDSHGNPQRIIAETPVLQGLNCYEVTFDDGQKITVSASHGWSVETRNGHDDGFVHITVSTDELAHMKRHRRSAISVPNGVRISNDVVLPVDAYLFGYWLVDGYAANGAFAVGRRDVEEVTALLRSALLTYETISSVYYNYNLCYFLNIKNVVKPSRDAVNQSMFQRLRTLGVLRNKHVPDLYLFAGTEQRRSLLQGMVDSDGSVTGKKGQVQFVNTNRRILDGFVEIARSLGYKPSVRPHTTSGWHAVFQVTDDRPIARVLRKQARVIPGGRIAGRRYIRSVLPVDSVPVKGLAIEGDSHTFQIEGGILTQGN